MILGDLLSGGFDNKEERMEGERKPPFWDRLDGFYCGFLFFLEFDSIVWCRSVAHKNWINNRNNLNFEERT